MCKSIVYYDRLKDFQNIIHKVKEETEFDYVCKCGEVIHKNDFFLNGEITEEQIESINKNPKRYHRPTFCNCMN